MAGNRRRPSARARKVPPSSARLIRCRHAGAVSRPRASGQASFPDKNNAGQTASPEGGPRDRDSYRQFRRAMNQPAGETRASLPRSAENIAAKPRGASPEPRRPSVWQILSAKADRTQSQVRCGWTDSDEEILIIDKDRSWSED